MKRITFKKMLILMLIIISILGFASCTEIIIPETGTVTITVDENAILGKVPMSENYYIYMNDVYQGMIFNLVPLTLENVPIGIHTFKASNFAQAMESSNLEKNGTVEKKSKIEIFTLFCSGMITSEISAGVNYVNIPVFCSYIVPY